MAAGGIRLGAAILEIRGDIKQILVAMSTLERRARSTGTGVARGLSEADQAAVRTQATFAKMAKAMQVGAAIAFGALSVAVKQSIRAYAEFEQKMADIQAVADTTGADLDILRAKSKELARTTRFSAADSAEAFLELAKAGLTAKQAISGIEATLDLAAAGGIKIEDAAVALVNTLLGFGLDARTEFARVADVMAKGAAISTVSIEDIRVSLKFATGQLRFFGLEMEEVVGALAALGNAGLRGSRAGTSLVAMFRQLINQAGKLKDTTGIEVLDKTTGRLRSITAIISELREKAVNVTTTLAVFREEGSRALGLLLLGGQTIDELQVKTSKFGVDAFKTLVTGKRIIKDFPDLVNELKAAEASEEEIMEVLQSRLEGFIEQLREAGGEAKRMAQIRLGALQSKLLQTKNAIELVAIAFGSTLAPAFQRFVEDNLIPGINALERWILLNREAAAGGALWAGLFLAALGPVAALTVLVGRLSTATLAGTTTAGGLLAIWKSLGRAGQAGVITAIIASIGFLIIKAKQGSTELKRLKASLDGITASRENLATEIINVQDEVRPINALIAAIEKFRDISEKTPADLIILKGHIRDLIAQAPQFAKGLADVELKLDSSDQTLNGLINTLKGYARQAKVSFDPAITKRITEYTNELARAEKASADAEVRIKQLNASVIPEAARALAAGFAPGKVLFHAARIKLEEDLKKVEKELSDLVAGRVKKREEENQALRAFAQLLKELKDIEKSATPISTGEQGRRVPAGLPGQREALEKLQGLIRTRNTMLDLAKNVLPEIDKHVVDFRRNIESINSAVKEKAITKEFGDALLKANKLNAETEILNTRFSMIEAEIEAGLRPANDLEVVIQKMKELVGTDGLNLIDIKGLVKAQAEAKDTLTELFKSVLPESSQAFLELTENIRDAEIAFNRLDKTMQDSIRPEFDAAKSLLVKQYKEELDKINEDAIQVGISLGGNIEAGLTNSFQAFRTGGDVKEAFNNFAESLTATFEQALAKMIVHKLHFDKVFEANFFALGKTAAEDLSVPILGAKGRLEQVVDPSVKTPSKPLEGVLGGFEEGQARAVQLFEEQLKITAKLISITEQLEIALQKLQEKDSQVNLGESDEEKDAIEEQIRKESEVLSSDFQELERQLDSLLSGAGLGDVTEQRLTARLEGLQTKLDSLPGLMTKEFDALPLKEQDAVREIQGKLSAAITETKEKLSAAAEDAAGEHKEAAEKWSAVADKMNSAIVEMDTPRSEDAVGNALFAVNQDAIDASRANARLAPAEVLDLEKAAGLLGDKGAAGDTTESAKTVRKELGAPGAAGEISAAVGKLVIGAGVSGATGQGPQFAQQQATGLSLSLAQKALSAGFKKIFGGLFSGPGSKGVSVGDVLPEGVVSSVTGTGGFGIQNPTRGPNQPSLLSRAFGGVTGGLFQKRTATAAPFAPGGQGVSVEAPSQFESIIANFREAMGGIKDFFIQDVGGFFKSTVPSFLQDHLKTLGQAATGLFGKIASTFQGALSGIFGIFQGLLGGIGSVLGGVASAAGGGISGALGGVVSLLPLLLLQHGGVVPQLAGLASGSKGASGIAAFGRAEGGKPEAIVPLPDGRSIPVRMTGESQPQDSGKITIVNVLDPRLFKQPPDEKVVINQITADIMRGGRTFKAIQQSSQGRRRG